MIPKIIELLEQIRDLLLLNSREYQKCPVCDGQGILNKPEWVAGDQETWVSNKPTYTCHLCKGKQIILKPNINVEEKKEVLGE